MRIATKMLPIGYNNSFYNQLNNLKKCLIKFNWYNKIVDNILLNMYNIIVQEKRRKLWQIKILVQQLKY